MENNQSDNKTLGPFCLEFIARHICVQNIPGCCMGTVLKSCMVHLKLPKIVNCMQLPSTCTIHRDIYDNEKLLLLKWDELKSAQYLTYNQLGIKKDLKVYFIKLKFGLKVWKNLIKGLARKVSITLLNSSWGYQQKGSSFLPREKPIVFIVTNQQHGNCYCAWESD